MRQFVHCSGNLLCLPCSLCLPHCLCLPCCPFQTLSQASNGWCIKEATQRQIHPKGLTNTRNHLPHQQRMASQCKEIVVNTHLGQTQHIFPHGSQQFLLWCRW